MVAGLVAWLGHDPRQVNKIRDIELKLRSVSDRDLLEILVTKNQSESRQLSLAVMEVDRRGGEAALRARLEPIRRAVLKPIGFWQGCGSDFDYPQPEWLTQPGWANADATSVLAYLRTGHACRRYLGYDDCRFPGCTDGDRIGSKEFTDGEWVWPEGLGHYVERHSIILPGEFCAKMRQSGWAVPPPNPQFALQLRYHAFDYDRSFWIDWSLKVGRTRSGIGQKGSTAQRLKECG